MRGLRALGLDRAILFTLIARGWSSLAGIITLALIARFLTRAAQGYYYTFYSLVALQIVFELGFSTVILQVASHEAAHLTIAPSGPVTGPAIPHSRLAAVLQKAMRWYTLGAIAMVAVLLPAGIYFFRSSPTTGPPIPWLSAWCLVVIASGLTFQVDPAFSFLEGCGFVPDVARARLGQAILGTILGWLALILHHGLLAPGLMILGQAVVGLAFLIGRRGLLIPLLRHAVPATALDWRAEVWPFQWRIAVSWACGFFISQLFNPILFRYWGPIQAGQMGMSISICGTLTSLAIAWMNTKAPLFGRLIALRNYPQLDSVFFRALKFSLAAAALACLAVWLTVLLLRHQDIPFALRLLPPLPLALLLLTTIANIAVFALAQYLRAHKQEKFMVNSILGAIWMIATALILGRYYGTFGIAIGYFTGTLIIGVGLGLLTFTKYRRLWHA